LPAVCFRENHGCHMSLFLLLLLICLLLNMLSAYLPIRLSLRGQIVKSINQKR